MFHNSDLFYESKVQKIIHQTELISSLENRGQRFWQQPGFVPHGSNHLTPEHWHLRERGQQLPRLQPLPYGAHGFLTQPRNINKHVCTQEVNQSNPSGTECWQGRSKLRGGGRWGMLLEGQSKGYNGLNPYYTLHTVEWCVILKWRPRQQVQVLSQNPTNQAQHIHTHQQTIQHSFPVNISANLSPKSLRSLSRYKYNQSSQEWKRCFDNRKIHI